MSKCGKSFLPECGYFTTGGCISPFNCPYRIEELSPNSATSVSSIYVQNLISENAVLKTENAALKKRLENAVELPCKVGDTVYFIPASISSTFELFIYEWKIESIIIMEKGYTLNCVDSKKRFCYMFDRLFGIQWFTDRAAAEARLKELKGAKNDR